MTITSKEQPLCRWCARPLKKFVRKVYLLTREPQSSETERSWVRYLKCEAVPTTMAECQKLTNQVVVTAKLKKTAYPMFGEWDGETYESTADYFCTLACSSAMGRAAVRSRDMASTSWIEAMKRRQKTAQKGDQ